MEEVITDEVAKKTITRANLANSIRDHVGLPRDECESILEGVLNEISGVIAESGV
jgi:hypothetical protein